ncbi:MAG: hypothetical protein KBD63_03215, partial [Bacteriovoracaceae bacterium]|nr:hypothetical protein [Bacteriovoracaceae bacterium]
MSLLDFENVKRRDYSLFGLVMAIFLIGILNLYSATHAEPDPNMAGLYWQQGLWFLLALFFGGIL